MHRRNRAIQMKTLSRTDRLPHSIIGLLALALGFSGPVQPPRASATALASELSATSEESVYLNEMRSRARMLPLSRNEHLDVAAYRHAEYVVANPPSGHTEEPNNAKFTGVRPSDRALAAGYRSRGVAENIYSEIGACRKSEACTTPGEQAIDSLMSAIYHRLSLLTFDRDEVGLGATRDDTHSSYVVLLGNSKLNGLCHGASGSSQYGYRDVCDPNVYIPAEEYEETLASVRAANPPVVLWPPRGATRVPPAFYEESPDPLPDYSVSGYPISLQFNPHYVNTATVWNVRVLRQPDGQEIQATRLLTHETDPNRKLSELEFALMPLARLDWGTQYRVEAQVTVNGKDDTLAWEFETQSLGGPIQKLQGSTVSLRIPPAQDVIIYVPPGEHFESIQRVSSYSSVAVNLIDPNTLRVRGRGPANHDVAVNIVGRTAIDIRPLEGSL